MSGLATLTTAELLCAVAAFTVAVVLVLIKLFKKEDYKSGTRSRSDHYSSRHQRKPEMDEEPAPAEVPAQVEESVEGTGAPIWYPLWLFGHEEAEKWLLPPRRDAGPPAILIDLSDPHNQGSEEGRAWIADSGAFLIAEEIWMTTDIRIAAAVLVNVEAGKLVQPTGQLSEYEDFAPFIDCQDERPVAVWGVAGADLEADDGIELRLRWPLDEEDQSLKGPFSRIGALLARRFIDRLVCAERAHPEWWSTVTGEQREIYAAMLDHHLLQILADKKNKALPTLDPDMHQGFTDVALEAAGKFPEVEQLKMVALNIALYSARADCLTEEHRKAATDLCMAVTYRESPIYKLAPNYLRYFGERAKAVERFQELNETDDPTFLAWLESLEL